VDPALLFELGRRQQVTATDHDGSIARRTLPNTFTYFNHDPCTFILLPEIQATFIMFYVDEFVRSRILRPWVGCALTPGCMQPAPNPSPYIDCFNHGEVFGDCHRFDQSILNILLYTNFGFNVFKRQLNSTAGDYITLQRT